MRIEGLTPLITLAPSGASKTTGTGESFGSLVRDAIDALDRNQQRAEEEIANAVAGESPDLHQTVVALQTSELNFQLGLQVRNKVIGAYEEIMRMQV
jgi:flagellar hook-basal body complex protein FliE